MKFSCTKENINKGLALVSHVAAKGASLPILSNILFKSVAGGIELTATNLEVAVTTIVRGRVDGDGSITIQGRLITDAVALLPNEKVEIEVVDTTMTLICGKSKTVIKGMAAEEFPVIPEVKEVASIGLGCDELVAAINRVIFAVNPDEGRPEISGVFLGKNKQNLVIAGTDSYRLAESLLSGKGENMQTDGLIIPLRTAQEVARVGQGVAADEVLIIIGDNQVLWKIGEVKIISRLVSGQYPDYQQIIPKDFNTSALVEREKLQQAVRAASLFVRSGINDVRLNFDKNKGSIFVSSNNSQLGENTNELEASINGESVEIIFNYRYLLDGLAALPGKDVKISVAGANRPSLFEPKESGAYRYLIMPIRQ
jgi:DNA polymerase-3 subunit beta